MKVEILKKKETQFKGDEGMMLDYVWYTAKRLSDDVQFEFGSREGGHEEGEKYDLDIIKYETSTGRIRYKEVVEA